MTNGEQASIEVTAVSKLHSKLQEKRRAAALERQKHARHRQMHMARLAATPQVVAGAAAGSLVQAAAGADSCTGMQATENTENSAMDATAEQQAPNSSAARRRQRRKHAAQRAQHDQRGDVSTQQQAAAMQDEGSEELEDDYMWNAAGARQNSSMQHQLQLPEWMTDVPLDLATHWLVLPRPEGPRCTVTTSRGYTVVRTKGGSILFTTHTALPEGGPHTLGGAKDFCVLDAVWHKPNNTLYVLDLLVWRGYALNDCTAEFRAYWLQGKLAEDPHMVHALLHPPTKSSGMHAGAQHTQQPQASSQPPGDVMESGSTAIHSMQADACQQGVNDVDMSAAHSTDSACQGFMAGKAWSQGAGQAAHPWVRVVCLQVLPANVEGLTTAYQHGQMAAAGEQFQQDGLYFMHKESLYCEGGSTPLALSWKDAGCSMWPVDTDAQGGPLAHQIVTLTYRMDCTVATEDDPPVVLGTMPLSWVQAMGPKLLQPGRLLRFSIRERGLMWAADGRPAGADLHYEGPANRRRGRADCFSKILFQQMARTQPLTWQHILSVAHQDMQAAATQAVFTQQAISSPETGMAVEQ